MTKVTATQANVLSAAAQRHDGAGTMPDKLNKAAAMKVADSLILRKLMREARAKAGMPVWREDGARSFSLIITAAGRAAVVGAKADDRPGDQGKCEAAEKQPTPAAGPRAGSKQALVVAMLSSGEGASLDALVDATGWLPHTTRAALTGLRKRGFEIARERHATKGSLYRIGIEQPGAMGA